MNLIPLATASAVPPAPPVRFCHGATAPEGPSPWSDNGDLAAIINSSGDAIVVVDDEGQIRFANPAASLLFGRSRADLNGAPFGFPVAPGRIEIDILPPDTDPRVVEMQVTHVPWQGRTAHLAILRDMTERKKIEQELRLAARVFDNATEGLLITDHEYRVLKTNHAFTEITGLAPEEIHSQSIRMLFDTESQRRDTLEAIRSAVNENGRWQGEISRRRDDGRPYSAWTTVVPVRNDSEEISHFIAILNDITEWKATRERLDQLAYADPLTGLPNRTRFYEKLERAIPGAENRHRMLAVLFVDLDAFKPVNDTFGHALGDALLGDVGRRLDACVREEDTVARLGGDEFIVLLSELGSLEDAAVVARKIIQHLSRPFRLQGHTVQIGVSVGIARYPYDGENGDQLVSAADAAMYKAKERGGNVCCFHDGPCQLGPGQRRH